MKKLLLIPAVCLMFFSCGGNQKPINNVVVNQLQDQSNPADWKTTLRVKDALVSDGSLKGTRRVVSISTTNGFVKLTGSVSSMEQMKTIIKKVKSVAGVVGINNKLTVSADK